MEELQQLAAQIRTCTLCGLHRGRVKAVPGEGPADAQIMCIGEGPGFHEDRQGRPFVGASGQYLDELLGMAGLQRADVFIANVVKCRPPQNRDPLPEEISTCTGTYLFRQIDAINPRIIITLGRYSMGLFLPGEKISRIHGQTRRINNRVVVPMLHPAAALHQESYRPLIEADFQRLPALLQQLHQEEAAAKAKQAPPIPSTHEEPPLEQLSMF